MKIHDPMTQFITWLELWRVFMKKHFILMYMIIFTITFTKINAFDGQRKGFILGFGLGGEYIYNNFSSGNSSGPENKVGSLTEFRIGYAPSNTFLIYYNNKAFGFFENILKDMDHMPVAGHKTGMLSLSSLSVKKYLPAYRNKLGVTGGVGSSWSMMDVGSTIGFGLFGGAGYDISKHFSAEAEIIYLNIGYLDSFGIRLFINVLAF